MTYPALMVRFQRQDDLCCVLCNPVSLADFERPCVNVTIGVAGHARNLLQRPPAICLACIELLARAAAGTRATALLEPEISNFVQQVREENGSTEPDPNEH